ncbi:MAG: hypothetical protein HY062_17305 [Bacteroidetes bacterium]|nr:hypothetical protein [Bacteroidota bacterium]
METEQQNPQQPQHLNLAVRTYFLQQGKHIARLNDILDSNILTHYLGKWLSVLIELILYALFVGIIICLFQIPHNIPLDDNNELYNKDVANIILCLQLACAILSLPILAFAILLGRNRKKNTLIRQAYEESLAMKHKFDEAVKTLNL